MVLSCRCHIFPVIYINVARFLLVLLVLSSLLVIKNFLTKYRLIEYVCFNKIVPHILQSLMNDLDCTTGDHKDEVCLKTAIMSFINASLKYGPGQVSDKRLLSKQVKSLFHDGNYDVFRHNRHNRHKFFRYFHNKLIPDDKYTIKCTLLDIFRINT